MTFVYIFAFLAGLCIGSFYNVLIYRLPRGISPVLPGSSCPHCGTRIKARDNVPLVSFILLKGRCRSCGGKISWRYPLVEFLTGLFLVLSVYTQGLSPQALVCFTFFSLLLITAFSDMETMIIPDSMSVGGTLLGIALSSFSPLVGSTAEAVLGALLGGGSLWIISRLYKIARKREGLGGGDIKLMSMLGAFTGVLGIYISLMISCFSALVYGIAVVKNAQKEFPFGNFLCLGGFIYSLLRITNSFKGVFSTFLGIK